MSERWQEGDSAAFANASQVRQWQQPLRLAPPWCVLTLNAIWGKNPNKTAFMFVRFHRTVWPVIAFAERTKRWLSPALVGVFRHLLTRVSFLVILDLTLFLFLWRMGGWRWRGTGGLFTRLSFTDNGTRRLVELDSRFYYIRGSWLKRGAEALTPLPNWPIFSSYSTVSVEAVPPTCSPRVVRIELAARKLALTSSAHTRALWY